MVADIQPINPHVSQRVKKVTADIVELLADLVERYKLTEREACDRINLNESTWYNWKRRHRNTEKYARLCSRIRGAAIYKCLDRIEKAGEDLILEGPDGKPIVRRGDWRADHARLQLIAPERFGDKAGTTNNTQVNILMSDARAQEIMDKIVRPQLANTEPKQLKDAQVVDNQHE